MKLLVGNGKTLEVRDVGPVIFELSARVGGPPIKFNGSKIMDEDEARGVLRELLATGLYSGGKVG